MMFSEHCLNNIKLLLKCVFENFNDLFGKSVRNMDGVLSNYNFFYLSQFVSALLVLSKIYKQNKQ